MEHYNTEEQHENILDDIGVHLVLASTGKRFVNYFIDGICLQILLSIIILIISAVISFTTSNEILGLIVFLIIMLPLMVAIYASLEMIGKGQSLGKLITGTKVLNMDGGELTWGKAIIRSLCRLIPFEPISIFFGRPWHDSISKTYVIDIKKSRLN